MKPIITKLEEIRLYIMQRLVAMNKLAFSLEDTITPSIRKRLEILKEKQREWVVYPSGFQELEVRKGDQRVMATCMWDDLRCMIAIGIVGARLYSYHFSLNCFGTNMWKRTNDVPPLPPIIRKMPGRPRENKYSQPSGETSGSHVHLCGGGRSGRGDGNDGMEVGMYGRTSKLDKERREEQEYEEKNDYFNPANWPEESMKEAPMNQQYHEVFIPSIHSQPTQQSGVWVVDTTVSDDGPAVDKGKAKASVCRWEKTPPCNMESISIEDGPAQKKKRKATTSVKH
ncbi:hypothetical protein Tco_1245773 [Tanacetum coccineum]